MGDNPCCDICESKTSLEHSEILKYLQDSEYLKHLEDILEPKPNVRHRREPVTFQDTPHQLVVKCSEKSDIKNPVPLKQYKLERCDELKYSNGNVEMIRRVARRQKDKTVKKILENIERPDLFKRNLTLTESNYIGRFHLLLWIEEKTQEEELQIHNQRGVKLITRVQNGKPPLYCIDVYGLADGRPSLIKNDFVRIHKENDVFVDDGTKSTKYSVFESRIKYMEKGRDEICVTPHASKFEYQAEEKVGIEFRLNRRTYQLCHRALDQLQENTPLFRTLFPKKGPEQPKPPKKNKLEFVNKKILKDKKQKQAIESILNKSSGSAPFILIGPPGTGKTATLIEAIYQLWKKSTSELPKICICAPSNPAVDVIVKRLLGRDGLEEECPILPPKLQENVMRVYALTAEQDEILQDCSTNEVNVQELQEKCIIAATTLTAGWLVDKGFGKNWFDYIFVDEAGQSTEPSILIPIAGFLHDKCHLVLAGDPKQLGPVVTSPYAKSLGLDVSLIERLKSNKCGSIYRKYRHSYKFTITLNHNYRSHSKIIKIPNNFLYSGQLKAKGEQQKIHLASDSDWEQLNKVGTKRHPVIFYGVTGKQRTSGYSPSSFNVKEIIVMKNYIEDLLGRELSGVKIEQNHIGIISPYRTQVEMIKKYLNHRKWNGIRAGSVESFQGSEKLIIIISTVRSRKEGSQFLKNERRFNVAITRAMALLIVIGDPEVLYNMKADKWNPNYWRKLIDDCHKYNSCKGKLPIKLQKYIV